MTDTLPDQELGHILSRVYKFADVTWSSASPPGTNLGTFAFPKVPAELPFFSAIFERFSYLRWKSLKISARLNGSATHYGCVALTAVPASFPNVHTANWKQRMNNAPQLLDPQESNVVELEIPWSTPIAWEPLPIYFETEADQGGLWLDVISELQQDSAAVQDVTISLYMQLVEPAVQGPNIPTSFANPMTLTRVHGQSKYTTTIPKHTEADSKTDTLLGSDQGNMLDTVEKVVQIGETAMKFAPLLGLMDKPNTTETPHTVVVQGGRDMPAIKGLDNSVVLGATQKTSLPVGDSLLPGSEGFSVSEMAQKPSFIGVQTITGLSAGDKIAEFDIYPANYYTTFVDGGPTYRNYSYISWVSNLFKYWRGSMRFYFRFFQSRFTSFRLRLVWFPAMETAAPVTISDLDTGDLVTEVIDITGTSEHAITVPWLSQRLWNQMESMGEAISTERLVPKRNGVIALYLENEMVNAGVETMPSCDLATWVAGGTDISFFKYKGFGSIIPQGLKASKKKKKETVTGQSVWSRFTEGEFKPLIPSTGVEESGLATSEEYPNWTELGKRYAPFTWTNGRIGAFKPGSDYQLQDFICAPFLWSRGSWNTKVFRIKGIPDLYLGARWGIYNGGPSFLTSGDSTRYMEFNVPWMYSLPYDLVQVPFYGDGEFPNPSVITNPIVDNVDVQAYRSFGDDFILGGLYAPPAIQQ